MYLVVRQPPERFRLLSLSHNDDDTDSVGGKQEGDVGRFGGL